MCVEVAPSWVANVVPNSLDIEARARRLGRKMPVYCTNLLEKNPKTEKVALEVGIVGWSTSSQIGTPMWYPFYSFARTQTEG